MRSYGDYILKIIFVPVVNTNCYLLILNNKAILFDAGGNGDEIIKYVKNNNVEISTIFITHGHYDHIEALDNILCYFPNADLYALNDEKIVIEHSENSLMNYELKNTTINKIKYINDNGIISSLNLDIKTISTPGHTIGSCCYYINKYNLLFSGDTLFRNTYGRTDLPTGDFTAITQSIKLKLFELPNETIVYPGHGFSTTIEYEKSHNDILINN